MPFIKEKLELEVEEAELRIQQQLNRFPPFVKWSLIVGILLVIPSYFIARIASHAYWAKAYSSFNILAKPSFANPAPLTIGKVSVTTTGKNIYAAVALVNNENLDLSADTINYHFNFYNAKHQLIIASEPDATFFLPNQKQFLIAPHVQATEPITSAELVLPTEILWQKRLTIPTVKLTLSQPVGSNQTNPTAFAVEGSVTNDSPYQLGKVTIKFVLYNNAKQIIATSQRDEFTVNPFEKRAYKLLWPNVNTDSVTKISVEAFTNTLEESNITLPEGNNPATGLGR